MATERDSTEERAPAADQLPSALIAPARRTRWVFGIPLLALVFAAALLVSTFAGRGPLIVLSFDQGHGIKTGDELRYRGIAVGDIERVELTEGLSSVALHVRLDPRSADLARTGSRFWVVRPHVTLDGIKGLETIVGARYLTLARGRSGGESQHEFVGLEEPPILERYDEAGLEITLNALTRYSLRPGAPISYRQITIGQVLSVGLSSDATTVEVRAYIRPEYKSLVRHNTRFWEVSGLDVDLGLMGGLKVQMESLRSLLIGGIAMATPTLPGRLVSTGHRFSLSSKADDEWLEWRPPLPVGSSLLPSGESQPAPLRASTSWNPKGIFRSRRERLGWVLVVEGGVVGPADLLAPAEVERSKVRLELAGESFSLPDEVDWQKGGLCQMTVALEEPAWPSARVRSLEESEDCVLIGDPAAPPMPLAAGRLRPTAEGWRVDKAVSFDERWHGACVLARADGALVGLLLVEKSGARIVSLP